RAADPPPGCRVTAKSNSSSSGPDRRRGTGRSPRRAKPASTNGSTPGPDHLPTSILAVDVGGSRVKVLASGQTEPRRRVTGPGMTAQDMVAAILEMTSDWEYEAVSLGYPGQVGAHGPRSEPGNLGPGWVGFNFATAFDKPVRIMSDAAMQALGS